MNSYFSIRLIIFLAIIFITAVVSGCEKRVTESEFLLNTIVDVTIISKGNTDQAMHIAFGAIRNVENLMSSYNNDSEIALINKNAGKSYVKVSPETYNLIKKSIDFSIMTDGVFDISVAPIVDLWGFNQQERHIPSENELEKALSLVGYKKILLDDKNNSVSLQKEGMKIDLGAIAVGYAVDKAINALKEIGINKALINAGGEIYALGIPKKKKAWRIGIQHPRQKGDLLGSIDIKDNAVSTSGDYENCFEENGKRYCHILNPKTGMPVDKIMSVTVIADNTTDADALSTALMLMKPNEAIELVERLENIECIIVAGTSKKDMKILLSKGLEIITFEEAGYYRFRLRDF